LVDKAHDLLKEGIQHSANSPQKLQNWILEIDKIFQQQLKQLPMSIHVNNTITCFNDLLENARKTYDEWLDAETNKCLK
jgi:hypothetical protein